MLLVRVLVNTRETLVRYSIRNSFEAQASGAILDLTGEQDSIEASRKNRMRWDPRKKKFVRLDQVGAVVLAVSQYRGDNGLCLTERYEEDQDRKRRVDSGLLQEQPVFQVEGEEQGGPDARER
jgi:ATP-dependent RNA helicase DDX54/DBP10